MHGRFSLLFFLLIAGAVCSEPTFAQAAMPVSRDANGRVFAKLVVTMNEPGAYGRPAADLVFLVVGQDGDRIAVRTNEAGVASTWLIPGTYRFVTPDPLKWEGYAYTWDRNISVSARSSIIQLTQDDARSISDDRTAQNTVARTSEPAALSSKPAPWKASVPATTDLRASVVSATPKPKSTFVATASTENAQDAGSATRTSGFHFGVALNGSAIKLDDDYLGESDTDNGGGLSLDAAYNFTPNLGIFVGLAGASISSDGYTYGLGHADLGARVFLATGSFAPYLEAAVSGIAVQGDIDGDDVELQGVGFTGGLGANFFLTQRLALDLNFKYTKGEFNTIKVNGSGVTSDDGIGVGTGRFNLGVTFYP